MSLILNLYAKPTTVADAEQLLRAEAYDVDNKIERLRDAFAVGYHMSAFTVVEKGTMLPADNDKFCRILTTALFMDGAGHALPAGSTISVMDIHHDRRAIVVVVKNSMNIVFEGDVNDGGETFDVIDGEDVKVDDDNFDLIVWHHHPASVSLTTTDGEGFLKSMSSSKRVYLSEKTGFASLITGSRLFGLEYDHEEGFAHSPLEVTLTQLQDIGLNAAGLRNSELGGWPKF